MTNHSFIFALGRDTTKTNKNALIGGGANSNGGSGMVGGGERSTNRQVLRRAFGNQKMPNIAESPLYGNVGASPFRLAFSAGDVKGTVNQAANPLYGPVSNQVNGITRVTALGGYKSVADGVRYGTAAYSGNPKYVYDGSDYVKYKKLRAVNRNYYDYSFTGGGGKTNFTSYSDLNRVRH